MTLNYGRLIINYFNTSTKDHPFFWAVATSISKTMVSDWIAQKVILKQDYDRRRAAIFGIFGFLHLGCFQYVVYSKVTPFLTRGQSKMKTIGIGLLLDQGIKFLLYKEDTP
eukprot:TRINITY_DN6405_c0_g1_i1.p2 TRINITY_DN6405_c0_g1~~TRINITY_DN6405_c0_g1_i1.p2  ORF type:complete len:111 (+),score=15.70 TRINITY_DN6405_c0_g1_i1:68-400(+)